MPKPLIPIPATPLFLTHSGVMATPASLTLTQATCLLVEATHHGLTEMAWGHHQERQLPALGFYSPVLFDSPPLVGQAPGLTLPASPGNPRPRPNQESPPPRCSSPDFPDPNH